MRHIGLRLPWAMVSLLVASVLLTTVAAGPGVLPGDVMVARWVQGINVPGAGHLARFTNQAGTGVPILMLAVGLILGLGLARQVAAAVLILATVLIRGASPLIKGIATSPRPTADLVHISEHTRSQGFPSGHVLSTTLLYGAVIYLAQTRLRPGPARRLVQALAVFMVLATGFGRVYVGAHWPSDVLGGYLWGTTLLLLLTFLHQCFCRRSFEHHPPRGARPVNHRMRPRPGDEVLSDHMLPTHAMNQRTSDCDHNGTDYSLSHHRHGLLR